MFNFYPVLNPYMQVNLKISFKCVNELTNTIADLWGVSFVPFLLIALTDADNILEVAIFVVIVDEF